MLRRTKKRILFTVIAAVVLAIIIVRAYLGVWLTQYVNRVLADMNGYHGSVQSITLNLFRGAYQINNLTITKTRGKFAVPFISAESIDLSVQWGALFHGRIVSDVHINKADINFAVDKTGAVSQTGKEIDWTKKVKELMPIDINEVTFKNSKIAYRDFSSTPNVNIFITDMIGEIHNLRNVMDANQPLPSRFSVAGNSIGHGTFHLEGKGNILKQIPDLDMATKLENVNLPALNSYSNAYAAIDFSHGKFSVYSELVVKDGKLKGYVKPIATDIGMVDLRHDRNPFKILWESLATIVVEIFKNQRQDQFATRVELSGDLNNIQTDLWSTLGGIFHNAFVQAFSKKVDNDIKF